ncbi:hypothetical protein SVIOM342S_09395 [Streptomyces violaceorubidus]
MSAETRQRRGALGAAGHDSVLTGRTGPAQHTRWAPHLVLLAAQPSDEDALRLAELAADAGRLGIGYLVGTEGTDLPGAAWEMEITGKGRLLAPLLGLELDAQMLPAAQRRAVVELFTDADPGLDPEGGPGRPANAPPFLVDISEQGRPAVTPASSGRTRSSAWTRPTASAAPCCTRRWRCSCCTARASTRACCPPRCGRAV